MAISITYPPNSENSGGSDNFLKYVLNSVTDITITHTFGREANVAVYDSSGNRINCQITLPIGAESSQVRIRSNSAITGIAILT